MHGSLSLNSLGYASWGMCMSFVSTLCLHSHAQ